MELAGRDPRLYQIAVLSALLVYGVGWLDFDLAGGHATVIVGTALATQYVGSRLAGLPVFDPRSAVISALSLCLLLRAGSVWLAALTAVVAIASKFVLRVGGRHVFNPTNLALVVMLVASGQVWVSPGQWGSSTVAAFLVACLGGMVVNRAGRGDVTLAFLLAWSGLVIGRGLALGDPIAVPLHRLTSGALLVFAFFMISDPRTTPASRAGRILFAALVASGGWIIQFRLFRTNGLLWSLALCSLLVPLINLVLPGPRHAWPSRRIPSCARDVS